MKRILIASDCFLPRWDGIARFLAQIIPVLSKKYQITIIAPKFAGKFTKTKGVKYHRFATQAQKYGDIQFAKFNYNEIAEIVKTQDIVFSQTVGPLGMSAIRAANKHKIPIVHYMHSIDWDLASKSVQNFKGFVRSVVKSLVRHFYHRCDLLLVPSNAELQVLRENKIKTPIQVVPMGLDTKVFSPTKSKSKARKEVELADRFTVGFVGRIAREKDLPTLFKAFDAFSKKHDAQLVIVGAGLTEIIPPHPRIIAVGAKGAVQRYLKAFDVFVLPSLTETSSLATIEAMACGLPIIATPVGMIPQYVKHEENGILVETGDTDAIENYLHILFKNAKLRSKLSKAARKTVLDTFSKKKMIDSIESVLQEVSTRK